MLETMDSSGPGGDNVDGDGDGDGVGAAILVQRNVRSESSVAFLPSNPKRRLEVQREVTTT